MFDCWIWLLIVLTNIAILIQIEFLPKALSSRPGDVIGRYLDILNVFFEKQSSTIALLKNDQPFTAAIFLFMTGVLLNNAYKNKNVYNMVTPRRIVPYEYFDQLPYSQVYSRAKRFYWTRKGLKNVSCKSFGKQMFIKNNTC